MEKSEMKKKVQEAVNTEEAISFLESLIRIPSETGKVPYAQELVQLKLQEAGFVLDSFPCETDKIKALPDFCDLPENRDFNSEIRNLAGVKKGTGRSKSLMLFSHIDTPLRTEVMPDYSVEIQDGRIYGLGAADAKGGIAMMLMAVQTVLEVLGEPKGDLTLLSTIGKRGSVGTLTAVQRGYHADAALYIHPAETGHGFLEIKNYSMGTLDMKISVEGKPGIFRDEIDDSEVSAVVKGAEVISAIQIWNNNRRKTHHFKEDTFAGLPNTKVNFLEAKSGELCREDALYFEISCRMCFGLEETPALVLEDLQNWLKEYFEKDEWFAEHPPKVSYGEMRATPAYVSRESNLIQAAEKNISSVKNMDDFIYQYHATSDIRMPIIYGETPTVGIGPLCGGLSSVGEKEWLDIQDYTDGIKIIAGMIVDWCY